MAHVVSPPAPTAVTAVFVNPLLLLTKTGMFEFSVEPSPIERALPQQNKLPEETVGPEA
jgi:hypothetical protein